MSWEAKPDRHDMCEELADLACRHGRSIATAESLTAGNLAAQLGRASDSGRWFRGGVVAYSKAVKHSALQVPAGPVVSQAAARAMARTVAAMVTGEGGPDPQEDVPPGTVWFGLVDHGSVSAEQQVFHGDPGEVLDRTLYRAVELLLHRTRMHHDA